MVRTGSGTLNQWEPWEISPGVKQLHHDHSPRSYAMAKLVALYPQYTHTHSMHEQGQLNFTLHCQDSLSRSACSLTVLRVAQGFSRQYVREESKQYLKVHWQVPLILFTSNRQLSHWWRWRMTEYTR